MQRLHLVELEDLPWVPAAIRDGGTDLLDALFARVAFYRPLVDVFLRALEATGGTEVVDLCSGGGGGALFMAGELRRRGRRDVRFLLTDRHPNEAAQIRVKTIEGMDYHPDPVDAMHLPGSMRGLCTMFGALHHFRPEEVRALLSSMVTARAHIAFFDVAANPALRRIPLALSPPALAMNMLVLFLLPFLMVPFVRPFRASRILLTFPLPFIPALFAWDGTVSALRAYAPEELLEIARSVPGGEGYVWDSGRGGQALFLWGRPAK